MQMIAYIFQPLQICKFYLHFPLLAFSAPLYLLSNSSPFMSQASEHFLAQDICLIAGQKQSVCQSVNQCGTNQQLNKETYKLACTDQLMNPDHKPNIRSL